MQVKQVYDLVNQATREVLGEEVILQENLENVIDVGDAIFNANAVDNYVKALVNHIGKVVFVNRPYTGRVPSVLMNDWEFGSVLEKVTTRLPDASENESWELEDGTSYDENIFYAPKVEVKFFNKKTTFEVPISITEMQVKESFSNAVQLDGFVSMIYTAVDNSLTLKVDSLIMRTINNFIGETINDGNAVRDVKLLTLYNAKLPSGATPLTLETALQDLEFLKFASYTIKNYVDRLTNMSTLFNIGGQPRHTPRDLMHIVMLSEFANASDVYLQSDTYHNELTKLPNYERVTHWQGTGTGYALTDISKINVVTSEGNSVEQEGIIGVIFDRDALGVNQFNKRVRSKYNNKAEFWNMWHKCDARYFNDFNENFVVFRLA